MSKNRLEVIWTIGLILKALRVDRGAEMDIRIELLAASRLRECFLVSISVENREYANSRWIVRVGAEDPNGSGRRLIELLHHLAQLGALSAIGALLDVSNIAIDTGLERYSISIAPAVRDRHDLRVGVEAITKKQRRRPTW